MYCDSFFSIKYPFHGEDESDILDAILSDAIEYPANMPKETLSLLQGVSFFKRIFSWLIIVYGVVIEKRSYKTIGWWSTWRWGS